MLLREIRLHNFRQYIGDNIIEFASDGLKNVTIILGDNTSGKTTLVQAFNWVLYGKANLMTQYFLNDEVRERMNIGEEEKVEVVLSLEHQGIQYVLNRVQMYQCVSKGDVRAKTINKTMTYKLDDGQTKSIDAFEIESSINKILPEGLSQYFFFDGERITSISNKQDVASSVKGLMGLDILESTRDHLSKVEKLFTKSLDLDGDKEAEKARELIDSNENRLDFLKEEIDNTATQIAHYQSRREQLSRELLENKEAAELQKRKIELTKRKVALSRDYSDSINDVVAYFNNNAYSYFGNPLFYGAIDTVSNTTYISESINGINANAISEIMSRKRCVCGTSILPGSKEESHLMYEKTMMPPESIGTLIKNYKDMVNQCLENGRLYDQSITSAYKRIRSIKRDLQILSDEIETISKTLLKSKDSSALEEEERSTKARIRSLNEKKDKYVEEKGVCEKFIAQGKKKLDSLVGVSKKNDFINICREYSSVLYSWVNDSYERREKEIRLKLEEKVNSIFNKMYHGRRTVVIDKNYKVSYSDVKTDESGGLETVKNFAFIAGLVDLGREKLSRTEDSEYDLGVEPYPLVMDAPFSKADEKHVSNISKLLPDIAEQVIMVLMEKDWVYAKNEIEEHLGKLYEIVKKSETHSYIVMKEVE